MESMKIVLEFWSLPTSTPPAPSVSTLRRGYLDSGVVQGGQYGRSRCPDPKGSVFPALLHGVRG